MILIDSIHVIHFNICEDKLNNILVVVLQDILESMSISILFSLCFFVLATS